MGSLHEIFIQEVLYLLIGIHSKFVFSICKMEEGQLNLSSVWWHGSISRRKKLRSKNIFRWDFQNCLLISTVKLWECNQVSRECFSDLFFWSSDFFLILCRKMGRLNMPEYSGNILLILNEKIQHYIALLQGLHTCLTAESHNQTGFR